MIYNVTAYAGKCDNCGQEIKLGGGEYMAYGEQWHVEEDMKNADWHVEDGKHYCDDCWYWDDEDNFCLKKIDKDENKDKEQPHHAIKNNNMTPEELLKPRYKVIADYPGCPYETGTILYVDEHGELYSPLAGYSQSAVKIIEKEAANFAHLVKPLEWWEDRKPEDMPGYVKENDSLCKIGEVIKVREWHMEDEDTDVPCFMDEKDDHFTWVRGFDPATEAEYNAYINKR